MANVKNVGTGLGGTLTSLVSIYLDQYDSSSTGTSSSIPAIQNQNSFPSILVQTLTGTAQQINIPSWAGGMILIPTAPVNTNLQLSFAPSDTAFGLAPNAPSVISFSNPAPAQFYLTTNGTVDPLIIYWF